MSSSVFPAKPRRISTDRELFDAVNYDMAYIFKYSIRKTAHARRPPWPQVPEETRRRAPGPAWFAGEELPGVPKSAARTQPPGRVLVEGPDEKGCASWAAPAETAQCISTAARA